MSNVFKYLRGVVRQFNILGERGLNLTGYATVVKKVCLIGPGRVGKTSLIKRFTHDEFEEKYLRTMGTKVSKKVLRLKHPEKDLNMNLTLIIWDIMGQETFRPILENSFFYGTSGCLAVCDLTRIETLNELKGWVESMHRVAGDVPLIIIANKKDLKEKIQMDENTIRNFADRYGSTFFFTSAKAGDNVEEAFYILGKMLTSDINYE